MPNRGHVSELMLYAVNTGSVYRFAQDVLANLARHKKRGKYEDRKALISWRRVADFAAQKGARVRTVDASDVAAMVRQIERRLGEILHKKDWTGLRFVCDPHAQAFPNAYTGRPMSTHIVLERGASGWFLRGVYRGDTQRPTLRIQPQNMADKAAELADYAAKPQTWIG